MSIIFVFLDGIGMATQQITNPVATAPMAHLHALLGTSLTSEAAQERPGLLLRAIDATL
ncbi:MAG: metalloenzyme, partial [Oscillochloris sp.]|nr:metalloenzyme [Oscillochloris sp.]